MTTPSYEKLGSFYLGKTYDLAARKRTEDLLLYDSKDLVTHAVCVGMTGSGKTGLCIGLIEEAAIDGIPSIVIDPKGDLSNLLLTFPNLQPADFAPWINQDDARKANQTPDQFAAAQASLWASGLAEWDQDGARIQRLKSAADFAIYTPGSSAGIQVSVLKSFDCPAKEIIEDNELFRERCSGTATSLMGLMGVTAETGQSREHILLSNIFARAWTDGQSLDIPTLIHHIQAPPFTKLGVMELESVFPAKDRFQLAMQLNNLVAAPGFSAWMEGIPLDIQSILYTPQGKPRVAVFSIAHLNDAERMFFVSLLLNQMLGWVRTQSGTTSLRALLYMDEIAGYFPPVANPPSKQPMLTLMKQARAFGVGCIFATQNPVDIDYKGLSNAGTWFIGRLQTQRDKDRVLDGLEGAAASASAKFSRADADRAISALGPRVFLMNNVHEDHPEIFETRWCLSYLRGPLTRQQIKTLSATATSTAQPPADSAFVGNAPDRKASVSPGPSPRPSPQAETRSSSRPVLPPEIPQFYVASRATAPPRYQPRLLGLASIYYSDPKSGIDIEVAAAYFTDITIDSIAPVDWSLSEPTDLTDEDLDRQPREGASFGDLPPDASKPKSFDAWKKAFADSVFRKHKLELLTFAPLKMVSKPDETERDFRARLAQAAREERDQTSAKLRAKYAPKLSAVQDRIRRAEQAVEVQKEQASNATSSTLLSVGGAILGAFLGRKVMSAANVSRATTAAKGASRRSKEVSDIDRAQDNAATLRQQLADLEIEFQEELRDSTGKLDPAAEPIGSVSLKPKKTNISVRALLLTWVPSSP